MHNFTENYSDECVAFLLILIVTGTCYEITFITAYFETEMAAAT
jgi:hypothetical protein